MTDVAAIVQLFRYSWYSEWPAWSKFLLFKALRHPARVDLKLRGRRWAAMTTKPSDLHYLNEIVVHESYRRIRPDLLPPSTPLVLDVGARCGAFALWTLSVNPGVRVISFEPGEAFENLAMNRALYLEGHEDRWQVEQCAISSKAGTGHFEQDPHSRQGHLAEAGGAVVAVRTIDSLGLTPQVLKIDAEGHEVEVLKGSEKTLATVKTVVLEYHSAELRRQCIELLSACNFALEEERELLIGRR